MFSGAVKLEDINDYILPSQDCVVPIISSSKKVSVVNSHAENGGVRPDLIKLRSRKNKTNVLPKNRFLSNEFLKPPILEEKEQKADSPFNSSPTVSSKDHSESGVAEVSLYDCLACSGCVTTSETVLIKEQSIDVFFKRVKLARFSVVSFSTESLDFLTHHYNCKNRIQCFRQLVWIFKNRLNVSAVIQTTPVEALVLIETVREFINRYKEQYPCTNQLNITNYHRIHETLNDQDIITSQTLVSTTDDPLLPLSHTELINSKNVSNESLSTPNHSLPLHHLENKTVISPSYVRSLPLLTSHCPGWICFAEKSQPSSIIQHISSLKTIQQILGHLIKTLMVDAFNLRLFFRLYIQQNVFTPYYKRHFLTSDQTNNTINDLSSDRLSLLKISDVYHTTIVPCYDKKLEIARSESRLNNPNDSSYHLDTEHHVTYPEVDTALATVEVIELLEQLGIYTLDSVPEESPFLLDDLFLRTATWTHWNKLPALPKEISQYLYFNKEDNIPIQKHQVVNHPSDMCACCHSVNLLQWNSLSGGFLEYTFRQAARHLFSVVIPDNSCLNLRTVVNKDFKEIVLQIKNKIHLRFLLAYGFRNIQNIVKQLTQSNTINSIDFVEIMACPRGCQHGGGQIVRSSKNKNTQQVNLNQSELNKNSLSHSNIDNVTNNTINSPETCNTSSYIPSLSPNTVIIPPHQHPFVPLIYRYLLLLESQTNHKILSTKQYFHSTQAYYRSILDEQKSGGPITLNALRW